MSKREKLGRVTGWLAVFLAAVALVPSSGPFAPAIVLTAPAIALSLIALACRVIWLPLLAAYWIQATAICSAWASLPVTRPDYLLALLGGIGVVLTIAVYRRGRRRGRENRDAEHQIGVLNCG